MYGLIIPNSVEKDIKRLPQLVQKLLGAEYLPLIQRDPKEGKFLYGRFRGFRSFKLSCQGVEYRIVYQVIEKPENVVLIMIGARENFYDWLLRRT